MRWFLGLFQSVEKKTDQKIQEARRLMDPENSGEEFNFESENYVKAVHIFKELGDHPVIAGQKDIIMGLAFDRRWQIIDEEINKNEVDSAIRHIDFIESLFPGELQMRGFRNRLRGFGGESKYHPRTPG